MVEVGRDLWRSSSPISLLKQDLLERITQGYVQVAFEYLQGMRLHSLSGQPVLVLCHLNGKEVLPHMVMKPPVVQFIPITLCSITGQH